MVSAVNREQASIGAARGVLAAVLITAFGLGFGIGTARAFSLHLDGAAGVRIGLDDVNALYGGDVSGREVLITQVGDQAPGGGGTIEDLGLPSLTPDGKVLFGAALKDPHRNRYIWKIFVGDPNASGDRVRPALALDRLIAEGCVPNMNTDPGPVSDGHGGVIFTGHEAAGKDALFLLSGGRLNCIARKGDQVDDGHELSLISFGTAQIGAHGEIVFLGWVEHERQALLVASPDGRIKALAVEDAPAPDGSTYKRKTRFAAPFGPPTTLPSRAGTVAAFTADTSSGRSLFVYRDGQVRRVLSNGTSSPIGPVTFLSQSRPGLMADGTAAVLSAFGKRGYAILRVNLKGKPRVILRAGEPTQSGTTLVTFGSPLLTRGGVMFLGAVDSQDHEAIYTVDGRGIASEIGLGDLVRTAMEFEEPATGHKICGGTLAINQRGDFTYLGGK